MKSIAIRKISQRIFEGLERLGYKISPYYQDGDCIFTNTLEMVFGLIFENQFNRFTKEEYGVLGGRIDCKKNEGLFLSLAAHDNPKSDYMKIFKFERWIRNSNNFIISFYICACDSRIDMWGDFENKEDCPIEASVEEIQLFYKHKEKE